MLNHARGQDNGIIGVEYPKRIMTTPSRWSGTGSRPPPILSRRIIRSPFLIIHWNSIKAAGLIDKRKPCKACQSF